MTVKYSIIIPTYNHCEDLLIPCIGSIFKYTNMENAELIISANGCTDNTYDYLTSLHNEFSRLGFNTRLKIVWNPKPLGFSKAINAGIKVATGDKLVLLNNDTLLLPQQKNTWLDLLEQEFNKDFSCGISGPIKAYSEEVNKDFIIFFCCMIDRKVLNAVGLLNESYGVGGGEDIEYCVEAQLAGFSIREVGEKYIKQPGDTVFTGSVPIYHAGERTVKDPNLVKDWETVFFSNMMKLAKKYNPESYKRKLENNFERAVFLKGDRVYPRETTRYQWAAKHLKGIEVLEIGCSTGYGVQFLPLGVEYTGVDYDRQIVEVAKQENWTNNCKFEWADINQYNLEYYDTIIAFEVIEHLHNGIEVVEKLKQHCDTLLITVPWKEPPGFWGEHHLLHNLDESYFPGFKFEYVDEHGNLSDNTNTGSQFYLMLCKYEK